MLFEETFRWYGPGDPVPLSHIRQTGATGVVTSLHHLPYGEVWSVEEIRKRKHEVEAAGLTWSVIESLPVHEEIKTGGPDAPRLLENDRQSLRPLAAADGPRVITYNFMPVLDWIRTDLHHRLPDGSTTLYFDCTTFAAFELFLLRREGAELDYDEETQTRARAYFDRLSTAEREALTRGIIDNFPGFKGVTLEDVRRMLARYRGFGRAELEANLKTFLEAVIPTAEECGCRLVIHPDDPPRPILGLPRIFSRIEDVRKLLRLVDSPANGVCFCAGSFSAGAGNDVVAMFRECAPRVGFLHLRSTQLEPNGNFYEANHLEGRVDMFELVRELTAEQLRRKREGRADWRLPVRPDHGHDLMDDLAKPANPNPGYHALGRMRGLAELRGLELGVLRGCFPEEYAREFPRRPR